MHKLCVQPYSLTLLAVSCIAIASGCADETTHTSKSTLEYLQENLPQTSE